MSYSEKAGGLPTGTWIAERIIEGRRRRKRFKAQEDADKWEKAVDETGAPPEGSKSFTPYPLSFIARQAKVSRSAWSTTQYNDIGTQVEAILDHFGRDTSVAAITNEAIKEFVKALQKRKARNGGPLSAKSINRYLSTLSALLSFSREQGWSYHAPKIPWQRETKRPIRSISLEEEERFLQALSNGAERTIASAFLRGGLKVRELFSLSPTQIQLDDGWGWITIGADDKARQVALPLDVARPLKGLIAAKQLPEYSDFYNSVKRAFASVGLDKGLSVQSLRQTALVRAGRLNPLQITQHFAGHASPKTTLNYLTPPTKEEVESAAHLLSTTTTKNTRTTTNK